jgi:ADP-ribose pyrophosphatase YjhB (NUDIX family)
MARVEHLDDPDAPKANSIVVAVTAFVLDDRDRILLIRRTDNDLWALPGGAQEVGEYIAETVVREPGGAT